MTHDLPVVSEFPWYARPAVRRVRAGGRGGGFMLRSMRRLGLLDKCMAMPIDERETVLVPLHWMYAWEVDTLAAYEREAIAAFAGAVGAAGADAVLVDCGADVGIYARGVLARAPNVVRVVAFEPNEASCALLRRNLAGVRVPVDVRCAGVLDEPGRGTLTVEAYRTHGGFVERGAEGDVALFTIDQLDLPADLVLAVKIDVEGGELRVLHGARRSLAAARGIVVQFEAHPTVAARTGVDPIECLRFLASLRECRWVVAEAGERRVSLDRPMFEQLSPAESYNLVVTSGG